MINSEQVEIDDKSFIKQYSDEGFYIERDGVKYSEAIDPADITREYTETAEPVIIDNGLADVELKAEAYDYLTGRLQTDEPVS